MPVTLSLTHRIPIKVVTILPDIIGFPLGWFILSAIIARGARLLLLASLLRQYGEPIRHFIEKRLGLLNSLAAGAIILLFTSGHIPALDGKSR